MDRIARLKNPVLEYAWGSRTAIPELLGLPGPSERPIAELWMGAHPKAPSQVRTDLGWEPLDRVIERDPVSVLGREAAHRFSNTLPFLFKVLAAASPLSIQVHPNLEQARAGFERESRLGIPLDAAQRNYKDPNHKPEILCAITRFEALRGFRTPQEIMRLLGKVCHEVLTNELALLERDPDGTGLQRFFAALLSIKASHKDEIIRRAAEGAQVYGHSDPAFRWVTALGRAYPGDMGILAPLMFHVVILEPGETIFIPAGQAHAYLKGLGVELMANSDNVIRGGLTPKHVDVAELVRIMDFRPLQTRKIPPRSGQGPAEQVYETPATEFQLSMISVSGDVSFLGAEDRSVDILIVMEGGARITGLKGGGSEHMEKGMSVIVPAAAGPYEITGQATLYRATVGGHS